MTDARGNIKDFSAHGYTYFDLDHNSNDNQKVNITALGIKDPKSLVRDFNSEM